VEPLEERQLLSLSPSVVAGALSHSPEFLDHVVTSAYQRFLGRSPDDGGLNYWRTLLQNGLRDEQLEGALVGSPEYVQNHGTNGPAWVTGLYQDLLGRAPDPAGLQYWLDALTAGVTPYQIAAGFAASPEREGIHVAVDYQQFLGRTPGPDEVGYWVGQLENGLRPEDLVGALAGSPEDYQAHVNDPATWLADAYFDILNRSPDPEGYLAWYRAMTDGQGGTLSADELRPLWDVIRLTKNALQAPQQLSAQFGEGDDAVALGQQFLTASSGQAQTAWEDVLAARPLILQAAALFDAARNAVEPQQGQLVDQGNQLLQQAGQLVDTAEQIWADLYAQALPPPSGGTTHESPQDWLPPSAFAQDVPVATGAGSGATPAQQQNPPPRIDAPTTVTITDGPNAGFQIMFLPDGTDARLPSGQAETRSSYPEDGRWNVHWETIDGKVTSFQFTPQTSITIQTFYHSPSDASLTSAYGQGTTAADKKSGNTSLGFHESRHRQDNQDYLQNKAFPQFNGTVGMTDRQFRQAVTDYRNAINAYTRQMAQYSIQKTDNLLNPPL
jgi:hypothetical protein